MVLVVVLGRRVSMVGMVDVVMGMVDGVAIVMLYMFVNIVVLRGRGCKCIQ